MATAKNRALDELRREKRIERKREELGHVIEAEREAATPDLEAAMDDEVGDDLLRLVFISCHPVLSPEARVALTLRLLGGLTTEEIARAFLVPEPTVAQRIVRAKRTLAEARVPFELPRGAELGARLSSVLEVVYLVFNEGYSATAGDDWLRPELCEDALRLGRILAELAPEEAEVHGLVALMEIQASRAKARVGASGEPGPEPCALGSRPHPPWAGGAGTRRGARRRARAVRPPGRHRRLSRAGAHARGDGVGAHRRALRRAGSARTVAGGGAESRRRAVHGVRSGGGAGARGCSRGRGVARGLPPATERPGRPAGQAGPPRRGSGRALRAASLTRNARERTLLLARAEACARESARAQAH